IPWRSPVTDHRRRRRWRRTISGQFDPSGSDPCMSLTSRRRRMPISGHSGRPFGTTERSTCFAKLAEAAPGTDSIAVGLFQRKTNLGPVQPAVGFTVRFGEERTEFKRVNLAAVAGLAEKLTIFERMT